MNGREDKKSNNLFFLCSLIEYIARKTKNKRSYIVNQIGKKELTHIYEYADIYHSENIDKVMSELIEKCDINDGTYDNLSNCKYNIPTHWDIGKVYKRLIIQLGKTQNRDYIELLIEVYNSWISAKIDDYNSSMYYENESYLYESYLAGKVLVQ